MGLSLVPLDPSPLPPLSEVDVDDSGGSDTSMTPQ